MKGERVARKTRKVVCRHCGHPNGYDNHRHLCYRCYRQPAIKDQYQTKHTQQIATVDGSRKTLLKDLVRQTFKHPLWHGVNIRSDSELYRVLFEERVLARLPGRHPDDLEPNLD